MYERFSKDIQNVIALGVAEQATQNYNEEKGVPEVSSFLFSRKAQEVFEKAEGEAALLSLLSQCFQKYEIYDLAVVENAQYGYLSLNLESMRLILTGRTRYPKKVKASSYVSQV